MLSFCWGFRLHRLVHPVGFGVSLPVLPYTYSLPHMEACKQAVAAENLEKIPLLRVLFRLMEKRSGPPHVRGGPLLAIRK